MKKRILALLLILVAVVGTLVVTAGAEGEHQAHCSCLHTITGVEGDKCTTHKADQAWAAVDPNNLPTSGYYYLTAPLELQKQWNISGDLYLCTNGFDIVRSTTAAENLFGLIRVGDNKSLTIVNCKAQIKDGMLDTSDPAKTSAISGALSTNTCGALFHLNKGADLQLYGVQIKDNESRSSHATWSAGAILACGDNGTNAQNVTISYAAFANNKAKATVGGAITVHGGTVTVSNTVFTGNEAEKQGGAICMINNASTVTLNNCAFTDNKAKGASSGEGGAALYLGKGSATLNNVTMTGNENRGMHGSAITQSGGTTLRLNGCTITGNRNTSEDKRAAIVAISNVAEFSVSGKTIISGNLNEGKESNVLLRDHNGQPKLTVGALAAESDISVRTLTSLEPAAFMAKGTDCPNMTSSSVLITYENNLLSTDANTQMKHGILFNGTAFSFGAVADHQHADCPCGIQGASCKDHTTAAGNKNWQKWTSTTSLPNTTGYYYLTGDVTLSSQQVIGADIKICTNGYDITSTMAAAATHGVIRVYSNGHLLLTNCKAKVTGGRLDVSEPAKTSTLSGGRTTTTSGGIMRADEGRNVTLYGVQFADNEVTGANDTGWCAGAIMAQGKQTVTIAYCDFTNNRSVNSTAGALSLRGGTADIRNTTFNNNYAGTFGGAITMLNSATALSLKDCDFTGNGVNGQTVTTKDGGALYVGKGTVNAERVTFTGNRASNGGAVYAAGTTVAFADSTFTGNQASNGGAVFAAAGAFNTTNTVFTGNAASASGGAVAYHDNTATPTGTIQGGSFTENTSGSNAGALYVSHAEVAVTGAEIKENTSGASGATYVRGGGKLTCTNVTMAENENTGANGSAITAESGSAVTLNGCSVVGNINKYDSLHAAVVTVDAATLTVTGETVIDGNLNGGAERNVFLRTVSGTSKMTVGQLSGDASIGVYTSALASDPDAFLTKAISGAWDPAWDNGWISYDNNGLTVAYNDTQKFYFQAEGQHDDHCLCDSSSEKCDHTKITWTPWGKADSLPTEGNYYLTKDVTLSKGVDINNTKLNLCLNGHTIKQTGNAHVLNIAGDNAELSIADCSAKTVKGVYVAGTITGGKNGAVLVRTNTFNLYGGILTGNTRTSTGGAVVMLGGGTFNMYGGQISGNESTNSSAGGVSVEKGSVMHLYDGILSGNKSMQGGAIALNEGQLYIYGGTIKGNSVSKHGGAIHMFKSTAKISGGTIINNTATGGGGAIQVSKDSKLTITGGKIEANTTAGNGGAIQLSENSQLKMLGGDICYNKATLGAGAYLHNSQMELAGGSIRNNTTEGKGEKNETIYGSGGGVLAVAGSKVTVSGGRIQDNLAWHGSGIYVINSDLDISGGLIQNNGFTKNAKGKTVYITRMGGGVYANGSKVTFSGGEVRGNRSENGGGIYVRQGSTLTMTGGEVANNAAMTGNGGGIVVASSSKATIKNGTIRNNNALVLGGGIFVDGDKKKDQGSTLVMSGGTVKDNRAEKGGGILLINYSHMDYTDGIISGNAVSNNGGGLFVANFCTMKMTGGVVKNNKAISGAGIQCYKAEADIYDGMITGNTALQNGGGIFSQTESSIILHGGTVTKNEAKSMGGGMFANVESTLGIYGGKVTANTAEKGGGVLVIDKCKLIVKGGTVEKNTATNNGGGIFVANTSEMKMTGGTVKNNKAISGAGLAAYLAKATMTGGTIEKNEASQHGAGFLVQRESVISMKDVTVQKNNAKENGGAIHISGFATLDLNKTVIGENTAGMAGGGIFASGDKTVVTLKDSAIRTNTAGTAGGGASAMSHARIVMESGKINHNTAKEAGGGIYVRKGYVDVISGEIFKNTAGTTGGGLSVEGIDIILKRDVLTATKDVKIYENTAEKGGGVFLGTGQATMNGTLIENNLATKGGGLCAESMGRSILENVIFRGNTAKAEGGGLYFRRGTKSYLTNCEITKNLSGAEGGGIWVDDDFEADSCRITENKAAKGAGGIYIAPANYDGEAYVSTVIKLGGNMQVTGNEGTCPGIYIGEGTFVNLMGKGLAQEAKMDVALATGTLTNTLFGAYNYEGENRSYVVTAGDRSITDPEPFPQKGAAKDVTGLVWIPVAVVAAVVIAVLALLLSKKKKQVKQ